MAKIKRWILILIIIFIIFLIILLGIFKLLKKTSNIVDRPDEEGQGITAQYTQTVERVTNRNNFYAVQNCINQFYTYYNEMFEDPLDGYTIKPAAGTIDVEKIKKERIEKVYNTLDEEYLKYKEITLENLITKLPKKEHKSVLINNMYCVEKNERIAIYFIYGSTETKSNLKEYIHLMVKVDFKNKTYKLLLEDYVEKYYKHLAPGQYVEIKEEEIKNYNYNTFVYEHINDEDYIKDLLTHYKNILKSDKEHTYKILLDKNYKEICFNNSNEYLTYINSNYSKIISARIDEYDKENKDGYTQYLFKDNNENYYIFKETAPFKYTVILDNYTIPTRHFTEEYNSSTDKEKAILNVKRFFMGIDDKNYGYSYSVLSSEFKNNKYPSKDEFIKFAKQNFFEKNEIEYISYEEENGLYIYKIKLTDATGNSSDEREFNIILKLNSGTNFEMSFGVE